MNQHIVTQKGGWSNPEQSHRSRLVHGFAPALISDSWICPDPNQLYVNIGLTTVKFCQYKTFFLH